MRWTARALLSALVLSAGGCAERSRPPDLTPTSPAVSPPTSTPGLASYYGRAFHGNTTASGVPFDMNAMVAAHPNYPFGTVVRVTNLENGRSVQVQIVDRGPAAGPRKEGVIIDLSRGAAEKLGFIEEGRTRVRLKVISRPQ